MDNSRPDVMTRTCGALRLMVRYDGPTQAGQFGLRHQWAYRIQDASDPGRPPAAGVDLYPARRSPANAREALAALVTVLTAAGRAYSSATGALTAGAVSLVRFPAWVPEAAHRNIPELTVLGRELATPDPQDVDVPVETAPTDQALWPPGQWYDIVFLQDEEGHRLASLIDARGPERAVDHLSGWDYGSETRDVSVFHDRTYTELPTEPGGHHFELAPYVLVWHTGMGHVKLLRQFEPDHEPPIWWLDRAGLLKPEPPVPDPAPTTRLSAGDTHRPSL
ncbi:hypothetical protein [Promicromonospora sp. NPDC023987]|uniref:hypothetical protein n=1 Tax=Promicromonospora sp. NPDC023987 TaxID=3155360 RepID=UPI0033D6B39D